MSATTTAAEVVTLEAAVRVLQVGNRQITQSVAKQLDRVEPWMVIAMGRIKIGTEERVIGRHKLSGDLVTARCHECYLHPPRRKRDEVTASESCGLATTDIEWRRDSPDGEWKRAKWVVIESPDIPADPPCECCFACKQEPTTTYRAATHETYTGPRPIPHNNLLPSELDYLARVELQATDLTEWVERRDVYVHVLQRHTGTGNLYNRQWLESLPLIVLAGLR